MHDVLEQAKLTIYFTPTRVAIIKKQTVISVDKDVEELEPSYSAGRNIKWYSCCGKQSGGSPKS